MPFSIFENRYSFSMTSSTDVISGRDSMIFSISVFLHFIIKTPLLNYTSEVKKVSLPNSTDRKYLMIQFVSKFPINFQSPPQTTTQRKLTTGIPPGNPELLIISLNKENQISAF
jgi:hypothetical protein